MRNLKMIELLAPKSIKTKSTTNRRRTKNSIDACLCKTILSW